MKNVVIDEVVNGNGIMFKIGDKVTCVGLKLEIEYFNTEHEDIMAGTEYGEFNVDLLNPIK